MSIVMMGAELLEGDGDTLAYGSSGPWTSTEFAVNLLVTYPSGVSANDLLCTMIAGRYSNSTVTTLATWTSRTDQGAAANGGTGTNGVDTGTSKARIFTKEAAGGESGNTSWAVSGNNYQGIMSRFTKDAASTWDVQGAVGVDTSLGGTYSAASATTLDLQVGDIVQIITVVASDATAFTNKALSASGITFGSGTTDVADSGSTVQSDQKAVIYRATVTAGSNPTATVTFSANLAPNDSGCTAFLRIREVAPAVTAVGKDLDLVWDTRAAIGDDLELAWDVREIVGDPLALSWDIRTPLGDTLALLWDVRAPLGDELTLNWDTRAPLGDTLALLWDVRAIFGDTLVLSWDARGIIGDTLAIAWDVRATSADDLALVWDVRSAIGDTLAASWDVRVVLPDSIALVWDVRSSVGDDLSLVWDVESIALLVAKELSLLWNADGVVGDTLALSWDTRAILGDELQVTWDIRAMVGDGMVLSWDVRSVVGDILSILWDIRSAVGDDLTLRWNISAIAGTDLVLIWSVESDVSTPAVHYLLSTSVPERWRLGVDGQEQGIPDRWQNSVPDRWRTEVTE